MQTRHWTSSQAGNLRFYSSKSVATKQLRSKCCQLQDMSRRRESTDHLCRKPSITDDCVLPERSSRLFVNKVWTTPKMLNHPRTHQAGHVVGLSCRDPAWLRAEWHLSIWFRSRVTWARSICCVFSYITPPITPRAQLNFNERVNTLARFTSAIALAFSRLSTRQACCDPRQTSDCRWQIWVSNHLTHTFSHSAKNNWKLSNRTVMY